MAMALVDYPSSDDDDYVPPGEPASLGGRGLASDVPGRADTAGTGTKRSAASSVASGYGSGSGSRPISSSRARKRKPLPALPSSFESNHVDDPSLHQGRKRTRPFVDGEYAAHVYLNLVLPSTLLSTLKSLLASFPPSHSGHPLHPLFQIPDSAAGEGDDPYSSLHISLTHPLALRRSQVQSFTDDLAHRLRTGSGSVTPTSTPTPTQAFRLSLAGKIKVYYNYLRGPGPGSFAEQKKGGRAFLALRVGAGTSELEKILEDVIHPILDVYHLPRYHSQPEFHTSFAWTLLEPPTPTPTPTSAYTPGPTARRPQTPPITTADSTHTSERKVKQNDDDDATTIDGTGENVEPAGLDSEAFPGLDGPYDPAELERINDLFEGRLIAFQPAGGWEINELHVKVAKEVRVIPLS